MKLRSSAVPLLVASALLVGCAGPSPYITPVEERATAPRPVAQPGTLVPVEPAPGVNITPIYDVPDYRSGAAPAPQTAPAPQSAPAQQQLAIAEPPPAIRSGSNTAVSALLADARQATLRGDYSGAESQIERALRITPRDPQIYLQLADVKMRAGDYQAAEQISLRGISVAAGLPAEQRALWTQLSRIRELAGDRSGAAAARAEASRL